MHRPTTHHGTSGASYTTSVHALDLIARAVRFNAAPASQVSILLAIPQRHGGFLFQSGNSGARIPAMSMTVTVCGIGSFRLRESGIFQMVEAAPAYCATMAASGAKPSDILAVIHPATQPLDHQDAIDRLIAASQRPSGMREPDLRRPAPVGPRR